VCAAIARQTEEAGRRVSRANEWAEVQARTNGRYGQNRSRSCMNGSTATANLRKGTENVIFYVSYKVLPEFLRMNVILTDFAMGTDTGTDT